MLTSQDAETTLKASSKESGIAREVNTDEMPENKSKRENIDALLTAIHEFCQNKQEEGEDASLTTFLSEISLGTNQDQNQEEEDDNKVTLMTIHASNGLEFKNLFITGLEEDLFPDSLSLQNQPE